MSEAEKLAGDGLRGDLRLGEPMRRHTSWKAGGAAERFYVPADLADLAAFIRTLPPGEPVHVIGLGSNLLVRDGGVRGTVVLTHGALKAMELRAAEAGPLLYAEAGVPGPKVARFAALHDLAGAEFLAGIPGTVGGALAMNAGCYGGETWGIVARVATLDRAGVLRERTAADYEIGYRHVELRVRGEGSGARGKADPDAGVPPHPSPLTPYPEEFFVAAWFHLAAGDGEASRRTIRELLTRRIAAQPLQQPNAGSVFRNPPGDHAARLIESCGLKGWAAGGAMVSPKHANFIVNTGAATAADIEATIREVQKTVKERTGVELVQEVRIIGEPAETAK